MNGLERATPPAVGLGRRILVVDDNEAARRGLSKHLVALGFGVTGAPNGREALEALRSPDGFDFVLTDLLLPDVDGLEVARAARDLPRPPRVALITGWELDADLTYYTAAGVDWVFLKPLRVEMLIEKLSLPVATGNPSETPNAKAGDGET